jgi:hypothetical protein
MAICPKCKIQELRTGEDFCLRCKTKKTNLWVKVGEGVVTVAVAIISVVFFKRPPKA